MGNIGLGLSYGHIKGWEWMYMMNELSKQKLIHNTWVVTNLNSEFGCWVLTVRKKPVCITGL